MTLETQTFKQNLIKIARYKIFDAIYIMQTNNLWIGFEAPMTLARVEEYINDLENRINIPVETLNTISRVLHITTTKVLAERAAKVGNERYYHVHFAPIEKKIHEYDLIIDRLRVKLDKQKINVEKAYTEDQGQYGAFDRLSAGWANTKIHMDSLIEQQQIWKDKLPKEYT